MNKQSAPEPEAKSGRMVLSVVTDSVENLNLREHYLPFGFDGIKK